jgi:predicted lipoprotein with Yx(FWY)xxD motif
MRLRSGGLLLVGVAALVTACGGSGSSPGSAKVAATNPAGGAAVTTHSGPSGTYLTDAKGNTLYMFAPDTATHSACNTACLADWPALTTSGSPTATGGADATKVGTLKMSSGAMQVSYGGHPLYYFSGDSKPGDTSGQGMNQFGGKWWELAASGQPITGKTAPAPSQSSSGSGGDSWG